MVYSNEAVKEALKNTSVSIRTENDADTIQNLVVTNGGRWLSGTTKLSYLSLVNRYINIDSELTMAFGSEPIHPDRTTNANAIVFLVAAGFTNE